MIARLCWYFPQLLLLINNDELFFIYYYSHQPTDNFYTDVSFRDESLRAFFVEDVHSRHIPPDLESRLFRRLQMIDDATTDRDLRVPPSNHFEKLRGNLAGFHSIRVNKQWRLIFRWISSRGEAEG